MTESSADIAAIVIETGLLHLDRPFDYRVPEKLRHVIHIGSHVRVRFAGRLVNGWVVGLNDRSEHTGRLSTIERVVGVQPVLTQDTVALCRAVAARYVGTFSDVVRAAVPPRHASAERVGSDAADELNMNDMTATSLPSELSEHGMSPTATTRASIMDRYPGLAAAIEEGERISLSVGPAGPGHDVVAACIAQAAVHGPVLVVVANSADVSGVLTALRDIDSCVNDEVVLLAAELGRAQRWRAFSRVLSGHARIVIGTRAAVFAPLSGVRTIIVWDDSDDSHREPHSPYWHTREVASLRSHESECGLIICGLMESVESAALVERGWLRRVGPHRDWLRSVAPRVSARTEADLERDPWAAATTVSAAAVRTAREALSTGPVLVLTPRRGYARTAWCRQCGHQRECLDCGELLRVNQSQLWCAQCDRTTSTQCPDCGESAFRVGGIGQDRIAEELGRALPGVPVILSNMDKRVSAIRQRPALIFATAGCEPAAPSGYSAVIILDVALLLSRAGSDAEIQGLRQMMHASALATAGAPVVVAADAQLAAVQALIRWDPSGFATRALSERSAAHLAPVARVFMLSGESADLLAILDSLHIGQPVDIVNPHPVAGAAHRMIISVPWQRGATVASTLREALALRQASRAGGIVHVRVDPHTL